MFINEPIVLQLFSIHSCDHWRNHTSLSSFSTILDDADLYLSTCKWKKTEGKQYIINISIYQNSPRLRKRWVGRTYHRLISHVGMSYTHSISKYMSIVEKLQKPRNQINYFSTILNDPNLSNCKWKKTEGKQYIINININNKVIIFILYSTINPNPR